MYQLEYFISTFGCQFSKILKLDFLDYILLINLYLHYQMTKITKMTKMTKMTNIQTQLKYTLIKLNMCEDGKINMVKIKFKFKQLNYLNKIDR